MSDGNAQPVEPQPTPSRRRRYLIQGLIALLVVVAVIVVVIVVTSNKNTAARHPAGSSSATPLNMASYGVLLTGKGGQITTVRSPAVRIGSPVATDPSQHRATVNIVEYIDFQCPACLAFEEANLNNTAGLVAAGTASLELHPIAFLDASSQGTRYSSRADNAAACVANYDPDLFLNATAALYEYQPKEGTPGLTNAQILTVIGKAGVSGTTIARCVNKETYRDWVTATTNAVEAGKFDHVARTPVAFQGTPTVFVDGVEYTGSITSADAFTAFVTAQASNLSNQG